MVYPIRSTSGLYIIVQRAYVSEFKANHKHLDPEFAEKEHSCFVYTEHTVENCWLLMCQFLVLSEVSPATRSISLMWKQSFKVTALCH